MPVPPRQTLDRAPCLPLLKECMGSSASFISVDLGASSGRVTAAHWDGQRFSLEELHRFTNGGVRAADRLYWDVLHIWSQIQAGLSKFKGRYQGNPVSVGVDAW